MAIGTPHTITLSNEMISHAAPAALTYDRGTSPAPPIIARTEKSYTVAPIVSKTPRVYIPALRLQQQQQQLYLQATPEQGLGIFKYKV